MSGNPLVASAVDTATPLSGTGLLDDGAQLVHAIESGDWLAGGLSAFAVGVDTVAAVSDPLGSLIASGLGWLIDHLEPIKGWFDDLTGNAGEVEAFAGTWANIQTQLHTSSAELTRRVADLDSLAGEAIDAYRRFQADAAKHLDGAASWAGAMSTGLRVASQVVKLVHDLVRDVLSQLVGSAISWAAEAVFSLGLATPWIIEQVSTRVASWVAKIGTKLTELLTACKKLAGLLGELHALISKAGALFENALRKAAPAVRRTVAGDHGLLNLDELMGGRRHVPAHTGLDAPPPHSGLDAPDMASVDLRSIDAEYRLPSGEVDPARLDDWAHDVSEAYPQLSPGDVRGLYDYTTNAGYSDMNAYLRNWTQITDKHEISALETRISATTDALSKLPAQPGITFRGVGMNDDLLASFKPGERWHDPAFLSTSANADVAANFAYEGAARGEAVGIIEIHGETGSDVGVISRYQSESEVLFQRGTEFNVISKSQDAEGIWHVVIEEGAQ